MQTYVIIGIIVLAGLVHATFQLGVSMVTLLASHAAGKKLSGRRVLNMVGAFLAGSVAMTALLASTAAYAVTALETRTTDHSLWEFIAGALAALGVAVWLFYYRRGDGTSLWLPRRVATMIRSRTQLSTVPAEAFSLGMMSVVAELIFMIVPLATLALAVNALPLNYQFPALALYVGLASLSLVIVTVMIGSGHKLGTIQAWREANKRFLQFVAGAGLLVLSGYIYVNQVVSVNPLGGGL